MPKTSAFAIVKSFAIVSMKCADGTQQKIPVVFYEELKLKKQLLAGAWMVKRDLR
jgi:hypothetical protein